MEGGRVEEGRRGQETAVRKRAGWKRREGGYIGGGCRGESGERGI